MVLRYRNTSENSFVELAEKHGWQVTKRGWPDFLCVSKSGEVFAVEVKYPGVFNSRGQNALKDHQIDCLNLLESKGIRCYISDGRQMQRYKPSKSRIPRKPVSRTYKPRNRQAIDLEENRQVDLT
jgi:hypothetical protein